MERKLSDEATVLIERLIGEVMVGWEKDGPYKMAEAKSELEAYVTRLEAQQARMQAEIEKLESRRPDALPRAKAKEFRADVWHTYAMSGYTYDVAQDRASQGGVHFHQVRKGNSGWRKRILQSNGRHEAAGPVTPITDAEGEAWFETAKEYNSR